MDEQLLGHRRWFLVALLCLCGAVAPAHAQFDADAEDTTRTAAQPRIISFTAQEGTHLRFDLSPDGEWIVLDLLGQLWRLPAEGGGALPLTDAVTDRAEDWDPSISPDGRWIAFQSDRPLGTGLWLMPSEGGTPRLLARAGTALPSHLTPAWSPDGDRLAYIREDGLYVHHLDRETTTQVVLQERPEGQLQNPAWLRDERLIVQILQEDDSTGASEGLLWLMNLETGRGDTLSTGNMRVAAPSPSPDGSELAFFARDDNRDWQLWLQDLDAGHVQQLTRQEDVLPLRARWTRGGEEIYYAAGGHLWSASTDGGIPRQIHFTARIRFEIDEVAQGNRVLSVDSTAASPAWPPRVWMQAVPTPILIQRARIIDGTGAASLGTRDILIEEGRISSIARSGSITPRRGMHVIAANGRVVIPGLIDLHQQVSGQNDLVDAANLYHGVTTARKVGESTVQYALLRKASISDEPTLPRGRFIGTELYSSGEPARLSYDSESCTRSLRAIAHSSDPVVFLSACSDLLGASLHKDLAQLYRDARVAVVPGLSELRAALEIASRGTELLREPGLSAFVTPRLRSLGGFDRADGSEAIARYTRRLDRVRAFVGGLHQSGVRLGTASGSAVLPGALHLGLEELVDAGFSPLEAIQAATSTAAAILGAEAEIGTIEEGKRADLIILDADPLEDIRNTREIWEVIKDGRVLNREELLEWARHQR